MSEKIELVTKAYLDTVPVKGDTGVAGEDGLRGLKGETGDTGAAGKDGINGTDGFISEEQYGDIITRLEALEATLLP